MPLEEDDLAALCAPLSEDEAWDEETTFVLSDEMGWTE